MKSKTPLRVVTGMILAASILSESRAVDRYWTIFPPDEGDFFNGINWAPSFETGWDAADRAIIDNGGTTVIAGGSATITEFWAGNLSGTSGNARITGGSLTLSDGLVVGRRGATGTLSISDATGPTSVTTNFLRIGTQAADSSTEANATLNLSGAGTTLTSGTANGLAGIGLSSYTTTGLRATGVATISNGATWTHQGTTGFVVGGDNATSNQNGGTGTLNITTGGSLVIETANLAIGRNINAQGTLNIDGGSVTLQGAAASLNLAGNNGQPNQGGNAVVNLNSGTITASRLRVYDGTGTFNLNGGTVKTGGFTKGPGTAHVNLNGVVIQITAAAAELFEAMTSENIDLQAGGVTIDTNNFTTFINQGINGAGGLTKIGGDALTLAGANGYFGPTLISGGDVILTGSIDHSNITVGNLATLSLFNFNAIGDALVLELLGGSALSLVYSGTEILGGLSIAGTSVAPGIYSLAQLQALSAGSGVTFSGDAGAFIQVSPVPEPSTWALIIASAAGAVLWRLRRSNQDPRKA